MLDYEHIYCKHFFIFIFLFFIVNMIHISMWVVSLTKACWFSTVERHVTSHWIITSNLISYGLPFQFFILLQALFPCLQSTLKSMTMTSATSPAMRKANHAPTTCAALASTGFLNQSFFSLSMSACREWRRNCARGIMIMLIRVCVWLSFIQSNLASLAPFSSDGVTPYRSPAGDVKELMFLISVFKPKECLFTLWK